MPQGIEVYNADGTLQFDTGNRLFRTLSTVNIGTTDGSANFTPAPGDSTFIARVDTDGLHPQVTVGSGTVSWNYGDVPNDVRGSGKLSILAY